MWSCVTKTSWGTNPREIRPVGRDRRVRGRTPGLPRGASAGDSGVGAVPWSNGPGDRRCGGQRRREVVVEGGIGGHGSRLRGRSTSLTAAVSRRLSPSSSVMPSVLRGCVRAPPRAPPRAPRAGRGVRPPAAGADAVRGPRFGVRFTGAGAARCRADANLRSQPAARCRRLDRGVAADA